jgi:hypothetical protein
MGGYMHRTFHAHLLEALTTLVIGANAQTGRVQPIGEVSFAVPDGWAYQAKEMSEINSKTDTE